MPFETPTVLQVTINGVPYQQSATLLSDSQELSNPTVPAAKTGALTTRTDNTSGALTMDAGHGFTTAAVIDLFWVGGSRRGVTVGTVATNSVPISGGSGDNLPALVAGTFAVAAMTPTVVSMALAGDAVDALSVSCPLAVSGWVVFKAGGGTVIAAYQIPSGVKAKTWASGLGITNPLAGATVATVAFSHGSPSAQDMTVAVVF